MICNTPPPPPPHHYQDFAYPAPFASEVVVRIRTTLPVSLWVSIQWNTPSYGYRNPHYRPKTICWPSQVYNGNPDINKTVFSWEWKPRVTCPITVASIRLPKRYGQIRYMYPSTHWGRATHTCVNKLTIISLDNGLEPGRRQAIIWTNAGILLIPTVGTNLVRDGWYNHNKCRLRLPL